MSEGLLDDYRLGAEIGRGSSSVVRSCFSIATGQAFAVKSIPKEAISDPFEKNRVKKEADFIRLVTGHPHIISLRDFYEDDGYVHLVLELCTGKDLFDRVAEFKAPMVEYGAAAVMRPLMEAIAHCHRRGVAHRDIKMENVLFDEEERLVLTDFGLAAGFKDGSMMEGLVGSPSYVAPEVVARRPYGEKVDVWSAGVILYGMLAGFLPFQGESSAEILDAVLRADLTFPVRIFHDVSSEAKDLLRSMLCKDVKRRLSAEQVLRHPWMTGAAM